MRNREKNEKSIIRQKCYAFPRASCMSTAVVEAVNTWLRQLVTCHGRYDYKTPAAAAAAHAYIRRI